MSKFQRPIVRATVKIDNGALDVIVFVVHLKSKRPLIDQGADPDDPMQIALGSAKSLLIRAAEAMALKHILIDETLSNKDVPMTQSDHGQVVATIKLGTSAEV